MVTAATALPRATRYSWYVLAILFLVYVVNYVDRQILSILAESIKRDLHLRDEELGFLYGTAFGVFYALFGIPFGRLADHWHRGRLMAIGLGLWSAMTGASGLAANGVQLAIARIGVGVGEATASPSAFSMLSDWFPRDLRATALSLYSAGIFVGGGFSLFIGGWIVEHWSRAFPHGGPLGLAGWQAAFLAVGLPGLALASWVATLREPVRGAIEGLSPPSRHPAPFKAFGRDLMAITPPFTLIGAAALGRRALIVNLLGLAIIVAVVTGLIACGESAVQWIAVGIGSYAVLSWGLVLKSHDPATFRLTIGSPAFLCVILAYGFNAMFTLAAIFWATPYALRVLHVAPSEAGLVLGSCGAAAGFIGMVIGGFLSDRLRRTNPSGRVVMILLGVVLPIPFVAVGFTTGSPLILYGCFVGVQASASWGLGSAATITQDLVLPRMRGTATAIFFISTTLLAFTIGPYLAGRISTLSGSLSIGVLSLLGFAPVALAAAIAAYRLVPAAERDREMLAGQPH